MKTLKYVHFTKDLVDRAITKGFHGHNSKSEVKEAKLHREELRDFLFQCVQDNSYPSLKLYREFYKTNHKGKLRHIKSPHLKLRLLQHIYLQIIDPLYKKKDPHAGMNCKDGFGITAKDRNKSVLKALKNLVYDRRDICYAVIIDQRKCYDHLNIKNLRKSTKRLLIDKKFLDFGMEVQLYQGTTPIGTPTSPTSHHVIMLEFDTWAKNNTPFYVRFADDCAFGATSLQEANQIKWRVKNFWWYKLNIRAKRHNIRIIPLDRKELSYCGYVYHRNPGKKWNDHNKGYTTVRSSTASRAKKCNNDKSWASYFGLMKHADAFTQMTKIENHMKLRELTKTIKLDRQLDSPPIDIKDLVENGTVFRVLDYEIRQKDGEDNFVKFQIATPIKGELKKKKSKAKGKRLQKFDVREFHGNYRFLINYIRLLENTYPDKSFLPLEDAKIVQRCGYIFEGSTNMVDEIEIEV